MEMSGNGSAAVAKSTAFHDNFVTTILTLCPVVSRYVFEVSLAIFASCFKSSILWPIF